MHEDCSQNVININMYIPHYQLFKKEWGSLTKRTPFFIRHIMQPNS